jgi:hypothetical protein
MTLLNFLQEELQDGQVVFVDHPEIEEGNQFPLIFYWGEYTVQDKEYPVPALYDFYSWETEQPYSWVIAGPGIELPDEIYRDPNVSVIEFDDTEDFEEQTKISSINVY